MNNAPPDPAIVAAERQASHAIVQRLHPGNRFRLMFGLPLLPQADYGPVPDELKNPQK